MSVPTAADAPTVVYRPPASAPATWAMGSLFEHLAFGEHTGGALGVALVTQPPGIATPLHRHSREAEAFYMLEGTMTYRAGEDTFELEPGAFLYLPQGLPHAFRIRGRTPARFVSLTTPGALLHLYEDVGMPATERRLPGEDGVPRDEEIRRWSVTAPRYGLEVLGPPIPE